MGLWEEGLSEPPAPASRCDPVRERDSKIEEDWGLATTATERLNDGGLVGANFQVMCIISKYHAAE